MKTFISTFALIALLTINILPQEQNFLFGAGTNFNLPIGSLSGRMEGALGGYFFAGQKMNENWTWVGKFEYFKMDKVNKDKLMKKVKVDVGSIMGEYQFPLTNLNMEFTLAGLSAEARYSIFKLEPVEAELNLGFGFYFWEYFRSNYDDSLLIDSTGNGDMLLVEVLKVPSLRQKDWSGGLNLGINFNVKVFEPVFLNLSGNYKLFITELWPTLALDIENVSGLQFFDIRAGLLIKL